MADKIKYKKYKAMPVFSTKESVETKDGSAIVKTKKELAKAVKSKECRIIIQGKLAKRMKPLAKIKKKNYQVNENMNAKNIASAAAIPPNVIIIIIIATSIVILVAIMKNYNIYYKDDDREIILERKEDEENE